MVILRKYNTATAAGTHIRVPIPKAGSTDFATGSDWTPASGDVKLSKDGGAQANIGTLPTYSNGAWEFQLTGTEVSCKQLEIMIVDSATKAIVDQCVLVETFGDASAMYQVDFSASAIASSLSASERNAAADAFMTRASSNWEASAPAKSLGTAVMGATHRVRDNAGTKEIYRSDGATLHASGAITTDASNDPVDEIGGLT